MFKDRAILVNTYRFFDLVFSIKSDSRRVLGVFKDIFGRFLINGNGTELSYYVLSEGEPSGLPAVIVDDRIHIIDNPDDMIGYVYMKVMDSALSRIKTHYLFHAAALSFQGHGVIFPAASKSGKTTLTLELVKRGFEFLSDDVAAISGSDHLLYPFPKGLGMLPSTLELCPEAELDSLKSLPMIGDGEKRLLDIGDLYPGRIGNPCRVRYLVFLGTMPEGRGQKADEEYLYIVLSRISDELMSDIRGIEGIKDLSIYPYKRYPILRLLLNGKGPILSRLEEVCQRYQVLIFDSSNGREVKANFGGIPRLEKIPKSMASLQLLKELKGGSRSAILQDEYGGNVSKLLMGIGRLLEGIECFHLTPGGLKERADLICDLVGVGE